MELRFTAVQFGCYVCECDKKPKIELLFSNKAYVWATERIDDNSLIKQQLYTESGTFFSAISQLVNKTDASTSTLFSFFLSLLVIHTTLYSIIL